MNIKWGIDKKKLYAIPYRNKDKPLKNSSFSSIILNSPFFNPSFQFSRFASSPELW